MSESIPYLPPDRRDSRYALWHDRYSVRVANIQTRSVDDVLENGFYISGEEAFDHDSNWKREQRHVTIVKMAEWWHHGANIFLVNPKDSEKIYKAIREHLLEWRLVLRGAYNSIIKPPVEDLLILESFAAMIYEHAKYVFDDNDRNSAFMKGHRLYRYSRRGEVELHERLIREREDREEEARKKAKGAVETKNVKVHVVDLDNDGSKKIDTDFSNRARYDNGKKHRSILDFLDPTKRQKE